MGPVGFSLLNEGAHALLLVSSGEESLEHASLIEQTLREAQLFGLIAALFGQGDRR